MLSFIFLFLKCIDLCSSNKETSTLLHQLYLIFKQTQDVTLYCFPIKINKTWCKSKNHVARMKTKWPNFLQSLQTRIHLCSTTQNTKCSLCRQIKQPLQHLVRCWWHLGGLTVLWCEAEVFCSSCRRLRATVVFPFSVFSSSMDRLSPTTSQDFISSWRIEITKVHHSLQIKRVWTTCGCTSHLIFSHCGDEDINTLMLQRDLVDLKIWKSPSKHTWLIASIQLTQLRVEQRT